MAWTLLHDGRNAAAPRARAQAAAWRAPLGNLWLRGGTLHDERIDFRSLADEWCFDVAGRHWTTVVLEEGPFPRSGAAVWHDRNGIVRLYGGFGAPDAATNCEHLTDLWKRDALGWCRDEPQNHLADTPGPRSGAAAWTDGAGGLCLFGGIARTESGFFEIVNDVWEYRVSERLWSCRFAGDASQRMPAPRTASAYCAWRGDLWFFGGLAKSNRGAVLGDLWKISGVADDPVMMDGGEAAGTTGPSARCGGALFADSDGSIVLFGGFHSSRRGRTIMNDQWRFNAHSRTWTCIFPGDAPSYTSDARPRTPSPRYNSTTWQDEAGTFWLFGGVGPDVDGEVVALGDLWLYAE